MTNLASECSRRNRRLRLALSAATALTLAACSGSADRFADFSDVSTSSLPDEQVSVAQAPAPRMSGQGNQRPAWQNATPGSGNAVSAGSGLQGSGTVTVQPGQTLYSIARANEVSPDQLASANNIAPPYAIRVGQQLRVPGRADPVAPAARFAPQTIEAANAPSNRSQFGQGDTHVVRPGETLFAVGRSYRMDPFTIARYNQLSEPYALSVGQTLRIPSTGAQASRGGTPAVMGDPPTTLDGQMAARQNAMSSSATSPSGGAPSHTAQGQTGQNLAPGAGALTQIPDAVVQAGEPTASTFRWPVNGRIISTYGEKPTGMRNEGINIAVPEGTSVRAAGSGIVAYAGNELKGYGNLVLIRHDGGWVTAYAHNKDLLVKRGDQVNRGDVIANAGQTGSVKSPQLHFEVRKGATAVDPMKHLDTSQAMN
jgi:murein DD-endopeptidase MepM/ murein hydrolase activator NlpD